MHTHFISARRPRLHSSRVGRLWLTFASIPVPSHSNIHDRVRETRKVADAPEDAVSPAEPANILQERHLEPICPTKTLARFPVSTDCHQAGSTGGTQNRAVLVEERHAGPHSCQSWVQRTVPGPRRNRNVWPRKSWRQAEGPGSHCPAVCLPTPASSAGGCRGGDALPFLPRTSGAASDITIW